MVSVGRGSGLDGIDGAGDRSTWGALGGFESSAVFWVVMLAAVVAAGFVAGVLCWARGHRIVGLIGLATPAAPVRKPLLEVARGLTNTEFVDRLHVSAGAVKAVIGHLITKIGTRNRVELAIWAHETGRMQPTQ